MLTLQKYVTLFSEQTWASEVLPKRPGWVDVESEVGSEIRVRIRDCGPKAEKIEYR